MGRRAKRVIVIPRWVDDEEDVHVYLCAQDACGERARATWEGARRLPAANRRFRKGQELFGKARDRSLSTLRRMKLLLRAENAFIAARQVACNAREAKRPEVRCPTCGQVVRGGCGALPAGRPGRPKRSRPA